MAFVIDASMAAAWLLPEEFSDAAETVIASVEAPCPCPVVLLLGDPQHPGHGLTARPHRFRRCSARHGTGAAAAA